MAESPVFPLESLPDELLGEVLGRVPSRHIVKTCVLVCKRWRDILAAQKLWKEKCLREHKYTIAIIDNTTDKDYKRLFFKRPYWRNLVINPEGNGMRGWVMLPGDTSTGGIGFKREARETDSDPEQLTGPPGEGEFSCWGTLYGGGKKQQLIDLLDSGCSPGVLDNLRPDIIISEWYAALFHCGCTFELKVELLSEDRSVLDIWKFKEDALLSHKWYYIEHTFSNCPPGVRYICYTHGGNDPQYWTDGHYHYGVKFTMSTVRLDISNKAGRT